MLINGKQTGILKKLIDERDKVYCSGLFLSARWFVLSQVAGSGMHMVVLPNKDAAEYCAGDLYNIVEGDNVFFLPDSGKNVERSNYKSSLGVQRTSAVSRILEGGKEALTIIVTYPDALKEEIPDTSSLKEGIRIRVRQT